MPFAASDLVQGVIDSRAWFLRHLRGVNDDQWNWKPYPEVKSIREILQHLVVDDLAALDSLITGEHPNYETLAVTERDLAKLLAMLEASHLALIEKLREEFDGKPFDHPICVWGNSMSLGRGIPFFSSEDWYHAGQVAMIRTATDPTWDYYASMYGDA